MDLKPGDRVINPRQPDWGPGEILSDNGAGKLHVYFAYAGEKALKGAPLEPAGDPLQPGVTGYQSVETRILAVQTPHGGIVSRGTMAAGCRYRADEQDEGSE